MTTRIGDQVHYVSFGTPGGEFSSVCRAATVTEVGEGKTRGLCVVNPTGLFFHPLSDGGCPYDSALGHTPRGGTWHGMDECNPDGATLSRIWSGDRSGIGPIDTRTIDQGPDEAQIWYADESGIGPIGKAS